MLSALILACGGDDAGAPEPEPTAERPGGATSPADDEAGLSLTSDAFRADGVIPARFTCDGDDVSPPLTWEGLPDGAESLVLIVDDPDAPGGGFTHWLLYNLDAAAGGLPEGVGKDDPALDGGLQGLNDFGDTGYGGPCPPEGEAHRYNFRLYVIDGTIDLGPGASADEVLAAIEGRMLALTTLTGTYERQ